MRRNTQGFDRNEVLTYKYSGTYDGWAGARAAVDTVLESEWANRSYNASGLPTFQYSSTGTGTVYFTSAAESPCSDIGNTVVARVCDQLGLLELPHLHPRVRGVGQVELGVERDRRLRLGGNVLGPEPIAHPRGDPRNHGSRLAR